MSERDQGAPRHGGAALEHAEDAPHGVDFHALVTGLAMEPILVVPLQARLADVGAGDVAPAVEAFEVALVDPTHVTDRMGERGAIGVAASQVGHELDAGQTMTADGEGGDLFLAQPEQDRHALEGASQGALMAESLDSPPRSGGRIAVGQGPLEIGNSLGNDFQAIGQGVVGEETPTPVIDQTRGGGSGWCRRRLFSARARMRLSSTSCSQA